jgi:hypothetical protein
MSGKVREWAMPGNVGRTARPHNCASCGQYVLRGLDREYGGRDTECDPEPLSPLGEVMALMAGLTTYESNWSGGQHTISRRDRYAIAAHIAGNTIDVLIEHDCKRSRVIDLPRIRSVQAVRIIEPLPIDPPF